MSDYIGDPTDFLGTLGPPTRFQPEWEGVGYKRFMFDTSPVGHVVDTEGNHYQQINLHAESIHLPVEGALLDYVVDTGYNPRQFAFPEHQSDWDYIGEQFGFPDSRPGLFSSNLPHDTVRQSSGDVNPMTGRFPVRDASEASLPRKPGGR
jgi:hypothetical protein